MVTHSVTMLEKHLIFTGEPPQRNFTTNRVKKRSIKPEDPMSHRIIEKRRRDRMNNCLADLSRLIPPEYLKKGRGRIEKTEIIEMAIKHMRHLQNIIASSRFNENSDNSVPSPPAATTVTREPGTFGGEQPIVIEHYRLGYLECLSEAMHFLVEVQGYFAGDSLCVQMINHLHKHCDKIIKGNNLNFPKKHTGEASSSESSTSPANVTYNSSPPLGMSNSTGSVSDDNQPSLNHDTAKQFDMSSRNVQVGHRSPRTYSDPSYPKNIEGGYQKYSDRDIVEMENRSDSEMHQNFALNFKSNEIRKEDSQSFRNGFETGNNFGPRNYSMPNGVYVEESSNFENVILKEESNNGPSQLREMLTSPSSTQTVSHINKPVETKGYASPLSNESSPCHSQPLKSSPCIKTLKENFDANPDYSETSSDNHHMMYKFKNNIKQRFSKEKRENSECEMNGDSAVKKPKPNEDYLTRDRLNLLERDAEEEKAFKFSADVECKKRIRYASESDAQDGDISNRLSFGHKSLEKGKKWDETGFCAPHPNSPKVWNLTNGCVPFYSSQTHLKQNRPMSDFSLPNNSFNNISNVSSESGPGIPIFALHAKGSFYIPLTLDHATLSPFLTILGITKSDEGIDEKTVLHPVTISVNFQPSLVR